MELYSPGKLLYTTAWSRSKTQKQEQHMLRSLRALQGEDRARGIGEAMGAATTTEWKVCRRLFHLNSIDGSLAVIILLCIFDGVGG